MEELQKPLQYDEKISPVELEKYDRQMILPQVGSEGQKKLKKARILIVGAGGLGAPAALYLAGAGVGTIGIMDADDVNVSNLHRQIIHSIERIGMNKAESAKTAIVQQNELVQVKTYPFFLTAENAEEIISAYDFVIDAADNFETKFLINDTCVLRGKPFCHAGVLQFQGQVMTYVPGEFPCFRCIFEEIPEKGTVPNCSQAGIIGAMAGMIGSIQALEAIKYILGAGELLVGKMMVFDGLTMKMRVVPFEKKNESCRVCGDKKQIQSVKENAGEYMRAACSLPIRNEMRSITVEELEERNLEQALIIDIRPRDQFMRGTFPGAVNIPLEDFEERRTELEKTKTLFLLCHTGEKSLECVEELIDEGYDAVNVDGGYRAYLRLTLSRWTAEDSKEEKEKKTAEIERSIIKKYRKSIWRPFTKALNEYQLIQEGDKIAVCISGGKDSMLLAKLIQELKKHGHIHFEAVFLVMNPGYNEDNWSIIQENARLLGIPITVFESDIFDTVAGIEKSPCYLCARMRRGYLYSKAKELGCNKIALGHHFDDVIETILMGMLYSGKVETMMPKLHSQNFEGMELIRPLYMVKEDAIKAWRDYNRLHFIQCACRFTENCASCGGGRESKRDEMKRLIEQFRKTSKVIDTNIFNSVRNINLRTVIGYHKNGEDYSFLDDYDLYQNRNTAENDERTDNV